MARILLVAILGLLRLSGAVDVKHQAVEASDARHASENHEEMEVQADGSAKAMMRREKGSEKEAGDPTQTTTVFEEGVGTDTTSGSSSGDEEEEGENEESLLRTDKELQRTKSDPDESEGSDEEESDEETTTTEQSDDSDDGDGLPEGEDLASTGSSKSTRSDETKDKAEKTKGEEDTEESDSDEESQGAEEDASDSMSSVEMEGFSTNAGPHHKAKAARSAGHPTDRHSAPHSKVESRHREAPVKATAKHASGKHSADKQPEKHKVEAQTKAEIKSHATHKMQRKKDSASLQEADTTQTTTYYFTLVASNKYCANANSGYKTNVGNYQTKACFEYVLNEASCGKFFDFGVVDGACDCVPKVETNCNQADADNYHVYLIQKGGPEALTEMDDQGKATEEVIGDPADHGDPSDD
ncbi:MDN1 [Symbiodinium necroappetens]|uniref:MDN1 protein n=1 Tax=Symbiodinium necroappetens TaxID=1628268 RepID=A0A812SUA5_9DINO|nr:MDN1 [Symbiodinium necroappetens]|mmetsp:Transcript_69855/g.166665  ORF Transcript_69855/g.166665 Transcript_69855/m.166665 type:complete len:413 (-) Transcript_69855:106-1344(-)|eukprot:CAMPEP_0181430222 /NCGR_PEP_ID=MMETSP1110-20121109/17608_1 /TAXON_ID=174948 /ORGANISM="Symbiodinium sp., Strain CCMP421" /LENGTH=412 /DNA_ID=CAMNT_0023553523 /DNA_START=81 /DNA_END=1319 /DNA_ORIENTATION=-